MRASRRFLRQPLTAQRGSPSTWTSSARGVRRTWPTWSQRSDPHEPYLRGAPTGLPFTLDVETLGHGLNFTLTSKLGDIDLLGEIVGGGGYEELISHSIEIELFGVHCRCLGLEKLIQVKRAAGRPKDFEALAELEAIRDDGD